VLHRFPYSIFYRIVSRQVVVIACFHGKRNPTVWRSRTVTRLCSVATAVPRFELRCFRNHRLFRALRTVFCRGVRRRSFRNC
jgi:hypothetical protein